MKKSLFFLCLLLVFKLSFAQSPSVIGAWYSSSIGQPISLVFKADGTVVKQTASQGSSGGIKLQKGNYVLQKNLLIITWPNGDKERSKLKFVEHNILQFSAVPKKKKGSKSILFTRVMDEEAEN